MIFLFDERTVVLLSPAERYQLLLNSSDNKFKLVMDSSANQNPKTQDGLRVEVVIDQSEPVRPGLADLFCVLGLSIRELGFCGEDELRFEVPQVGEETLADADAGYNRFGPWPKGRPRLGMGIFELLDGGGVFDRSSSLDGYDSRLFSCERIEDMLNVALENASDALLDWHGFPISYIERSMPGLSEGQRTQVLSRACLALIVHHDAALADVRNLAPGTSLDPELERYMLPPLVREAYDVMFAVYSARDCAESGDIEQLKVVLVQLGVFWSRMISQSLFGREIERDRGTDDKRKAGSRKGGEAFKAKAEQRRAQEAPRLQAELEATMQNNGALSLSRARELVAKKLGVPFNRVISLTVDPKKSQT